MKWEILSDTKPKDDKSIIDQLLLNRGIKNKSDIEEFLDPTDPTQITFEDLGISNKDVKKVIDRIKAAKDKKEKIVIFGDYDADGVCATAIIWEALYKLGYDVMPYIPDRFEEGYGIKDASFDNSRFMDLKASLIITVDNGIVAYEGLKRAKKLGVDVIVVDHHQKGEESIPSNYKLHSTLVCGSALSWFLAKELGVNDSLDLATIGTVADQMPLTGINRSIVKFGLKSLSNTKRVGLKKLIVESKAESVTVYDVGFIIAPRINAMGRLANATDSLRFLCTRDPKKAHELTKLLNDTNIERQKIVEDVVTRTLKEVDSNDHVIVIEGNYHEGVIGLASGRVTEKFYRPSIVLSRGEKISKASARSIFGFNIIAAIKETGLILEGGGHPMAAGFSIESEKISEFKLKINEIGAKLLTTELLERKLKVDIEINFDDITESLVDKLKKFEPIGNGNFSPIFLSKSVKIIESKTVGSDGRHLKIKLEQNNIKMESIWFNADSDKLLKKDKVFDIVYSIEENTWNNKTSIQLKIKDLK